MGATVLLLPEVSSYTSSTNIHPAYIAPFWKAALAGAARCLGVYGPRDLCWFLIGVGNEPPHFLVDGRP